MTKASMLEVAAIPSHWAKLSAIPGGKKLFSRAIGLMAPFTATIRADVQEMRPGYARAEMGDRRAVRNHLKSIHAVALVNLCELTGNLALIASVPPDARMIVTGLSIEYLAKARGRITAIAEAPTIPTSERKEYEATVRLQDRSGELVARATVKCLVGPRT